MTLTAPEGLAGQISAIGLALLAALALWLGALTPCLDWYGGRAATLQAERQQAAHMAALARGLPALRAASSSAARTTDATVLLPGRSDAIAGAALQSALQNLAAQSGTSLDSATMLAGDDVGALRRIGVSVSVSADWPALAGLLAAIDGARPRMVVDDLTINGNAPFDPGQDAGLQATFTVSGFRAAGGGDTDGGS